MKIKITRKHIKEGKPVSAFCCPVACAVQEATGDMKASVSYSQIMTQKGWMLTPKKVQEFLDRFDRGKSVKPFDFVLRIFNPR